MSKGNRKHRNVSTPAYREGWDNIFPKKDFPKMALPPEEFRKAGARTAAAIIKRFSYDGARRH